jgi:hypothetical protein
MTYILEALRRLVIDRAKNCCEYWLLPQDAKLFSFEIDHIVAEKHRGNTSEDNLCLACIDCNRHKGSDFASFDENSEDIARLFNPRRDQWRDHFKFDGATIKPLTATGRVTVFLLQLNDEQRIDERTMLIAANRYPPSDLPVWKTN